jgi:hypothetical protein
METVKAKKGRAKISWESGSLQMEIPSRKSIFILFLIVWLAGWAFGEISVGSNIMQKKSMGLNPFMIVWLIGWTVAGLFAFTILAWNLFGSEILTANSISLKISIGIGKLRYNRQYDMSQVNKMRVVPKPPVFMNQEEFMHFRSGRISFDYGMRTYRFASGIDEAEADYIIGLFKDRGLLRTESDSR